MGHNHLPGVAAFQGRKKCKTSNILILFDANGIPIACRFQHPLVEKKKGRQQYKS